MNNLSASGSIHTSHRIILQNIAVEEGQDVGHTAPVVKLIPKTGKSALNFPDTQPLPGCYVTKSKTKSPWYRVKQWKLHRSGQAFHGNQLQDYLWVLLRLSRMKGQEIPAVLDLFHKLEVLLSD